MDYKRKKMILHRFIVHSVIKKKQYMADFPLLPSGIGATDKGNIHIFQLDLTHFTGSSVYGGRKVHLLSVFHFCWCLQINRE